jgi:hypothetical protein
MMAAFVIMIIMGIVADSSSVRGVVMPMALMVGLGGFAVFLYSKWIEQPGIRAGADLVKRMIENNINPKYVDSPHRITWTVSVKTKKKATFHMGKQFLERPMITIYALRSANDEGVLTDWVLPNSDVSQYDVEEPGEAQPAPDAGSAVKPAAAAPPIYAGPGLMSAKPGPLLTVDATWS